MFKKCLFSVFALAASVICSLGIVGSSVYAASSYICGPDEKVLGVTLWCAGVDANPDFTGDDTGAEMQAYVTLIATNIGQMILDIGAYVAIIIVMYGGFIYLTSQDNPATTAKAKKIIANSIIGLIIIKSGSIIVGAAKYIAGLVPATNPTFGGVAEKVANEIFLWAGIVVVIMIAWGGLNYVMSSGDPGKMAKAKKTIISSLIGLAIIILAAVVVNAIINTLGV